jgi:hypothetical protein
MPTIVHELKVDDFILDRMTATEREKVWTELREIYDEDIARQWLNTPHPLLGAPPCESKFADVMRILDQMKSGAFV